MTENSFTRYKLQFMKIVKFKTIYLPIAGAVVTIDQTVIFSAFVEDISGSLTKMK